MMKKQMKFQWMSVMIRINTVLLMYPIYLFLSLLDRLDSFKGIRLRLVDILLDKWSSYSRYNHQRRLGDISKVKHQGFPLTIYNYSLLFRITYGIKPSGSIVYMNKDGGGSLDLLNIRSMAKVFSFLKIFR